VSFAGAIALCEAVCKASTIGYPWCMKRCIGAAVAAAIAAGEYCRRTHNRKLDDCEREYERCLRRANPPSRSIRPTQHSEPPIFHVALY
jgi:hypothetical protein